VLFSIANQGVDSAHALLHGILVHRTAFSGSLDNSFAVAASIRSHLVQRDSTTNLPFAIYADPRVVAVQPDGKVLFVYLDSGDTSRLVRLNADGSVDDGFASVQLEPLSISASFPQMYDPVTGVTLQPAGGVFTGVSVVECEVLSNGQLVISGAFRGVNGTSVRGIARLNANGTVDSSFQVGQGPMWTTLEETPATRPLVEQVEPHADDKLLLTGTFEAFNGVAAPGIVRLNPNGSVDTSFIAPVVRSRFYPAGSVLSRQADGSFLLSGPYSAPNDNLRRPTVLRLLAAPALASAASRKTHGTAGSLRIDLPLSGSRGVECRSGGATGNHTIVFTFNNPMASGSAAVTSGTGTVVGPPTVAGKTLAFELSGVANAQTLTITLQGATDAGGQALPDSSVTVGFLVADVNGDGAVNSGDALQTRARSGQAADATNFRADVNADGIVNSGDAIAVRGRSGTSLP
jgi:uncharacterized delta-60 repeat protein